MIHDKTKNTKRAGQVRAERRGEPVYTAIYKVNRSDTLLEFLLRKCKTSRNNVKTLLSHRQVLVNGSVVTQFDFPLAKDDEVKLSKNSVQGSSAKTPVKDRPREKKQPPQPIKIIYEDEDFIAIDKPAGLLSVESDKETECAFGYAFEYLKQKDKKARPYILHRIDKETSGVLVFAKNPKIYSMLKMHWNELVTTREYVAVTEGVFEKKEDTIISYLKENKNNLVYSTQDITGQKAITHYTVRRETDEYSLVSVVIDTGRKNQIRVHLQSVGHPVVGDDKYGGNGKNPLKRLGLHAAKLVFIHPVSKELLTFTAPVPSVFFTLFGR
ncbi:MAG: RluA family pseudouridine synthase [Clostridia bacterium]|nr:RluA family pseudouridine synthase [Clostridia bacterium]